MAPIQEQIDARLAELEAATKARLGAKFTLMAEFKRDSRAAWSLCLWTYSDWIARDILLLASGWHSIDETFDAAFAALAKMRTFEDECADLGLPVAQPARAA